MLDHLARARMDRKNDREFDRNLPKRFQNPEQYVRFVDVRGPVQCQCCEATRFQSKALHQIEVLRRYAVPHERIDHDIADKMYPLFGDAFLAQIFIRKAIRGEQVFAQNIGAKPVDLFWHTHIARTQTRFDMRHLDT